MGFQMLFLIGAPRSGTTMLERMLSSHTMIQGGPEPHLMTPLAHLGVWAKVDKAPYDHILAAEAQRLFVQSLPNKEQDYWDACRAYCDVLYGRSLAASAKSICLDKTPAYALALPFITKVYPDGKYVVLTRHPIALYCSFANSFFDGDFQVANEHNPILRRYVPALAAFFRQPDVSYCHVRYEDLVLEPEAEFERICRYIGIPFEPAAINYGTGTGAGAHAEGLGDPTGVRQHTRPEASSVDKWVSEIAADPGKRQFLEARLAELDPADLECLGYPPGTLWAPLERTGVTVPPAKPRRLDRYALQRKLIVQLRKRAQKRGAFRKALEKVRLTTDVLLRE